MSNNINGWIGIDLDGTLAYYDKWIGPEHIGDPIPKMIYRTKKWISEGKNIKIMTARVNPNKDDAEFCKKIIEEWCMKHIGKILPITHEKDLYMIELWDDRVVQVIPNTGERADGNDDLY